MWTFLSILAVVALLAFFSTGANAVWGGAKLGLIVGIIVAAVRDGFDWPIVWKAIVIGTLCGVVAEVMSKMGEGMARNIDGS